MVLNSSDAMLFCVHLHVEANKTRQQGEEEEDEQHVTSLLTFLCLKFCCFSLSHLMEN